MEHSRGKQENLSLSLSQFLYRIPEWNQQDLNEMEWTTTKSESTYDHTQPAYPSLFADAPTE
jgi:hypothetical protein